MAANRTKTIEYALPTLSAVSITSGTYTVSADTNIYIPETTSRAFKSVTLEVVGHDAVAVTTSITEWGVEGSCDAGNNYTTTTVATANANSGENHSFVFIADMTAEFTARFGAGTSGTFQWGIYVVQAAGIINDCTAKLYITYEYDDTAHSTRIKTVRIPIESNTSRLTNILAQIGTNQVPALNTFLPESSKVYRQIFFELWTNTAPSAVTDTTFAVALDAEAEVASDTVAGTMLTPISFRMRWVRNDMATDTVHALKARSTAVTSTFTNVGGWLTVTYEYDHENSTSIMNSLVLDTVIDRAPVQVLANAHVYTVKKFIEEPGTITLKQSGIFIEPSVNTTSASLSIAAGAQAARTYSISLRTGQATDDFIMHRVDSGGAQGAGIAVARGENTWTFKWYASTANAISACDAKLILNYTSDKAVGGDGVHAHSIHYVLFDNNITSATVVSGVPLCTPNIIEPNYYLVGAMYMIYNTFYASSVGGYSLNAKWQADEGPGAGWCFIGNFMLVGGGERQFSIFRVPATDAFMRYPGQSKTAGNGRMDIEAASRNHLLHTSTTGQIGVTMWATYHSFTKTVNGTITGYTGDGSGITVDIFRQDTDELIGSTTTSIGGGYTFTWHDDIIGVYAVARQDSAHVGRSDNGNAA
jgi:hypothetical protein